MADSFCLFSPSIIHGVPESCWRVLETGRQKWRERGGILMMWGRKALNKVAEIHTHKPGRAGEAMHRGLLFEKQWFESLELRKALGWICSAPAQAVFRLSCLNISSCSPDCRVTQSHILIWFQGKHQLLSSATFIALYTTGPDCFSPEEWTISD